MKYKMPITYEVCTVVEIEANSLEEAYNIVNLESETFELPDHPEFVDGSIHPTYDLDEYQYLRPYTETLLD